MPWWGWMVIGAILLCSELFIDSEFYLVIFGFACLAVGLGGYAGLTGPPYLQWVIFAALSIVMLMFFRARIYQLVKAPDGVAVVPIVGEFAVATAGIEPGATGEVELRGTTWTGRNVGTVPLEPGDRIRVDRVEGLIVDLKKEE